MISVSRRTVLRAPREVVLARLADVGGWHRYFRGLTFADRGGDLEVSSPLPRPFRLRLAVRPTPDGVRVSLVEGELARVEASFLVDAEALSAEVVLESAVLVPPGLSKELTDRVVPDWLDALVASES